MGRARWGAATCGLLSAAAGLAASEVPPAASARFPSLVASTGQRVIRSAPGGVVHRAIEAVGTADKPLLVGVVVVIILLAGAVTAPLALRRPVAADLLTAGVAGLGWASTASLGAGPDTALVPAVAGAATAILTRRTSLATLSAGRSRSLAMPRRREPGHRLARGQRGLRRERAPANIPQGPDAAVDLGPTRSRRGFLAAAGIGAGTTAVAVGGSVVLRRSGRGRPAFALPGSADGAGRPTDGLAVPGLSPLITPTGSFYRIDEALVIPTVDVASWRLRVSGLVGAPFELSYAELLAEPLVEGDITMCCVSNEVGGRLVGTARWTGVRLADLLRRAGVDPSATQVVGRSVDGFTTGFPVTVVMDGRDALIAVGMNGETLPPKHGFPARLVIPGLYGFVSATKWLREIELTTWEAFEPYWAERGWSRQAPVKVSSRIDVPKDYTRVAPGRQAIAGVAWAPTSGIRAVAIRIDGGEWQGARLGPSLGDDAWRQWWAEWDPSPGTHTIEVQAVTSTGLQQTEEKRSAFPDGASGLHTSHVRVVPAA